MRIDEAVRESMETGGLIRRREDSWDDRIAIKPTNSYKACIGVILKRGMRQREGRSWWNPTADDIMADDWEVIKEESLRQRTEDS